MNLIYIFLTSSRSNEVESQPPPRYIKEEKGTCMGQITFPRKTSAPHRAEKLKKKNKYLVAGPDIRRLAMSSITGYTSFIDSSFKVTSRFSKAANASFVNDLILWNADKSELMFTILLYKILSLTV